MNRSQAPLQYTNRQFHYKKLPMKKGQRQAVKKLIKVVATVLLAGMAVYTAIFVAFWLTPDGSKISEEQKNLLFYIQWAIVAIVYVLSYVGRPRIR